MLKKITIVTLVLLIAVSVYAQQPLQHKYKFYTDPNGRLFVNKNMPMYIRLSSSPDPKAESVLLKSETSPQYSNPFYFDTEGYNTLRTPSQVDTVTKKVKLPVTDIIFEVYTDSENPKTSSTHGEAPKYKNDGMQYYGKNLIIPLTAKDITSGVEKIYQSVDGAAFQPYTKEIVFDKEKKYSLKYYSVDNTGNAEEVIEEIFTVDLTSPQTTHSITGDYTNTILAGGATIVLAATDAITGVAKTYYSIDGGAKVAYTAPIKMAALKEGEHILTYYSVDNVKNDETEKSFTFFVDKTPPLVVEEVLGDQFFSNGKEYSSGRTKLKLTAVDNKAGVKAIYYSIDGGEYLLYDKPFYFSSTAGTLTVKTYSIDNVNNESKSMAQNDKSRATYVDLTGPSLDFAYSGKSITIWDTVYINADTKIILKANDPEAGVNKITYNIDKGAEITYDESFKIEKEGLHVIDYYGYDNVNNSNRSDFFFVVDTSGPEIFSRYGILSISQKKVEGKVLDVFPEHVALFLSATDALVGFDQMFYSINGEPEKPYKVLITEFKRATAYSIKVRALDKLGNQSETTIEFMVE